MTVHSKGGEGVEGERIEHLFSLPPISEARYRRTKMAKVCSYKRFALLDKAVQDKQKNVPAHVRVPTLKRWPTSEKTNLLTTIVVFYLKQQGCHAERVNTTGIYRKDHRGQMRYTPGGGTKGSADIHAVIDGMFTAIEIKYGKDRLSEDQKAYRDSVQAAGSAYLVVKTFDDLIDYLEDIKDD